MHPGAARYQAASRAAISPRETELAAFSFVIAALENAASPRARIAALGHNHKLWSTLLKDLSLDGNLLPPELKSQLLALGAWSMQYSTHALLHPLPLDPLIAVNRNIIDGLNAQAAQPKPQTAGPAWSGQGAIL